MTPSSRIRSIFAVLLAAMTLIVLAGPVAARSPLRATSSETSLECPAVSGATGIIRIGLGVHDAGAGGLLRYWAPGSDPATSIATLGSQAVSATIGADGSITGTFDMYLPVIGEDEPVFVGTAELTVSTKPGQVSEFDRREQVGNHQQIVRGINQELIVTTGSVDVPTAGAFDLAGGECIGTRTVETSFATQPDVMVSSRELIEADCFVETPSGFVAINAQSGITDTFAIVIVADGADVYFTEVTDPELTVRALTANAPIPLDGDPSVVGNVTIDARFDVVERFKGRTITPDGWQIETAYDLAASGVISIEAPGLSLALPMDGCFVVAQVGHAKAG